MRVGEYEIVVESRRGQTETRATWGRTPIAGEEIEIGGRVFVVNRVRHREEQTRSTRVYTAATCYVRALGEAGRK